MKKNLIMIAFVLGVTVSVSFGATWQLTMYSDFSWCDHIQVMLEPPGQYAVPTAVVIQEAAYKPYFNIQSNGISFIMDVLPGAPASGNFHWTEYYIADGPFYQHYQEYTDGSLTYSAEYQLKNAQIMSATEYIPGPSPKWNPGFLSTPVPEPATICILGLGALSLIRRKK